MQKTTRGIMQRRTGMLLAAVILTGAGWMGSGSTGTVLACDPKPTAVEVSFALTPVVEARSPLPAGNDAQVATKIFTLRHVDPKGMILVARELLGRRSHTVLVTLPGTKTLVAKGNLQELRYLSELIRALDTVDNEDERRKKKVRKPAAKEAGNAPVKKPQRETAATGPVRASGAR